MAFEIVEIPTHRQHGAAKLEVAKMLAALKKQPSMTAKSDMPSNTIRHWAYRLKIPVSISTDATHSYVRLKETTHE